MWTLAEEAVWRSVGGLLEIAAVITILVDVSGVRRHLMPGHPTVSDKFTEVLRRLKRRRNLRHVLTGAGTDTVTVTATVKARVRRGEQLMTPDERLDYHREVINEIEGELDRLRSDVDVDRGRVYEHITRLTDELRTQIERVDDLHRSATTGGLRLRVWSVPLLVGGIALTTWSREIANALG